MCLWQPALPDSTAGAGLPFFKLRRRDLTASTGFRPFSRHLKIPLVIRRAAATVRPLDFMKADIHPKYEAAEIRCACGNVIHTRSTRRSVLIGICNECHPFYTGQQKFVDTAGRVDKFQQRMARTAEVQAALAATTKKKRK
jgi:large subunit ribosomal protein L31